MLSVNSGAGYEEVGHTADRAVHVWAPDMAELLRQAALGMYAVIGVEAGGEATIARSLHFAFDEPETLLVEFLSGLLAALEGENLVFSRIDLVLSDGHANFRLAGRRLDEARVEVKAVTYHDLNILHTGRELEATVVFDV